jgi:IclR family transcriptional regulator, KDG regulon repressor
MAGTRFRISEGPRDPRYTLRTLEKGLMVLDALHEAGEDLTLTEIRLRVDEPPAVVFRILRTFVTGGHVQQDPATKRYRLGLRLWELGAKVANRNGLIEAARPVLRWITATTGETSALAILRDTDSLYIDMVDGSEPLRVYAEPGSRVPIYATASGKAMLAFREPELVERVVGAGMPKLTPLTITAEHQLRRRLAEIRRTGLAVNHGERRADIAALAAPIFNAQGECVAAISISGPVRRFHGDNLDALKRHVRKAGEEISAKLGHGRER